MALNKEAVKQDPAQGALTAGTTSQKHSSPSQTETQNSRTLLLTHRQASLGLGRTVTPNSQSMVFTAKPPTHSQITNQEKLSLFKREYSFSERPGHRKHPFEKVLFSELAYWTFSELTQSQVWNSEEYHESLTANNRLKTKFWAAFKTQPLGPGTNSGTHHGETRILQAILSERFKQLFSKILIKLSTWIQCIF